MLIPLNCIVFAPLALLPWLRPKGYHDFSSRSMQIIILRDLLQWYIVELYPASPSKPEKLKTPCNDNSQLAVKLMFLESLFIVIYNIRNRVAAKEPRSGGHIIQVFSEEYTCCHFGSGRPAAVLSPQSIARA